MTPAEAYSELARCDEEIKHCEAGGCIGAAIGWRDWSVERRLILKEVRLVKVRIEEV